MQWKLQIQEIIFIIFPSLFFNFNLVNSACTQKHLGMILDLTLDFKIHVQNVYITVNKTILLLCKFHSNLPRTSLITIYKSFIRRHLNYGEINSNQAYSNSFQKKWNQFNKMDQIFNGSGGSFQIQELGLESIQNRSWYRKFC